MAASLTHLKAPTLRPTPLRGILALSPITENSSARASSRPAPRKSRSNQVPMRSLSPAPGPGARHRSLLHLGKRDPSLPAGSGCLRGEAQGVKGLGATLRSLKRGIGRAGRVSPQQQCAHCECVPAGQTQYSQHPLRTISFESWGSWLVNVIRTPLDEGWLCSYMRLSCNPCSIVKQDVICPVAENASTAAWDRSTYRLAAAWIAPTPCGLFAVARATTPSLTWKTSILPPLEMTACLNVAAARDRAQVLSFSCCSPALSGLVVAHARTNVASTHTQPFRTTRLLIKRTIPRFGTP